MGRFVFGSVALALAALVGLLVLVEAVDRHKFRTCQDTSFCKRHRDGNERQKMDYYLDMTTVKIDEVGGGIFGSLLSERWPLRAALDLNVFVITNGLVRIRIRENSPLHSRWEVRDVLQANSLTGFPTQWQVGDRGAIGSWTLSDKKMEVHIQAKPLVISLVVDGKIQMQANSRNLLTFEQYRNKNPRPSPPSPPAPQLNEDGTPVETPVAEQPEQVPVRTEADPSIDAFPFDEHGWWEESWSSHSDSKPRGPAAVSMDVTFAGASHVYGIPEHASSFSLKSTRGVKSDDYSDPYRLYNLDVFEYELDVPMALYGAVPFMMSHTRAGTCGLFWLNSAETYIDISDAVDVDNNPLKETHWISESGIIDAYLLPGPTPEAVWYQYAALTGFPALPQRFAIAYHQCRWNYKNEEDVANVDGGFDEHDIPYDVLWLDIEHTDAKKYFTWDQTQFPTPKAMQEKLAAKGRKMVSIVDPHIKRDNGYYIHNEATSQGLYVKNPPNKGGDFEGWCWPGSVSYPDFAEPSVRNFWSQQFSHYKYEGSTPSLYIWNDMNEPSVFNGPEVSMPKDCLHWSGTVEHRDVHNMYGFYTQMATADGLERRHASKNDRPFVLTRSFFSGSQQYGAVWTGDNRAAWSHLAAAQPMLLSLGIAGITFSGADVGGFFGDPEVQLLTRWYQAGAYQPFFRGHAHIDTKRREPWVFGEPHTTLIRNAIRERYALLPYLYTTFYQSSRTGIPVLRPLWAEFSGDVNTHPIEDSFLLGDSILVKPISSPDTLTSLVYLPINTNADRWFDAHTYSQHSAGQTHNVAAPLEYIPVFYRGGRIIARRERPRRSSDLMEHDPFTLIVALDLNGQAQGHLYSDDGHSFDYKKGGFLLKKYDFSADAKLTSIGADRSEDARLTYEAANSVTIERIVVLGVDAVIKQVTVRDVAGNVRSLDFSIDSHKLTIRKPNVKVADDWTISFAS